MNKNIYLLTVIGFMSSSSAFAQQNTGEFLAQNQEVGSLCAEYKKDSASRASGSHSFHNSSDTEFDIGFKKIISFGTNLEYESNQSGSQSREELNSLYEKNCDKILDYLEKQGQRQYEIEKLKIETGERIDEQRAAMRERMEKYKVDTERENNKYKHDETKESISSNERINLYKIQTDYSSTNNTNATNYLMMDRQLQTEELKDVRRESVIRDFSKQDEIRDDLKKQRKY